MAASERQHGRRFAHLTSPVMTALENNDNAISS